jgi:hypothetical protein
MTTFNSGTPVNGNTDWQLAMLLMLRSIIGDLDSSNYTYTDDRLVQILSIAAYDVNSAATFLYDYTVEVPDKTITPDPVVEGDQDFAVLTVYKAACIILGSEVKTQSCNAIAMKDGPSSIDLRGVSGSLATLQKTICGQYEEMLNKYRFAKTSGDGGMAVLSPYSPGSWGVLFNGSSN